MILPSLNLVGDEDAEGLLEDVFDIRFTETELKGITTVGGLHDVIVRHLPARTGACETSMTFYRLRRGLIALGTGGRISPATPLPHVFSVEAKKSFRALTEATGLKLPPTEAGLFGVAGFLLSVIGLTCLASAGVTRSAILLWAGVAVLGSAIVFARRDRGRMSKSLVSVGDLSRETMLLNFGRMVRQGSRVNDEMIWDFLRHLLGEVSDLPPEQIGRATLIYPPEKSAA